MNLACITSHRLMIIVVMSVVTLLSTGEGNAQEKNKKNPLPDAPFDYGLKARSNDSIYITILRPNSRWLAGKSSDDPTITGTLCSLLFAQALGITAEFEFGLQFHDRDRGHAWPAEEGRTWGPYEIWYTQTANQMMKLEIFQNTDRGRQSKFTAEKKVRTIDWVEIAVFAAELRRKEFPEFLKKEGYTLKAISTKKNLKPSPAVIELTSQFHEVALLAGVHQLEQQILTEGISAPILELLIHSYAHLGLICEYFCWPVDKVYKARSMILAEEFKSQFPNNPQRDWHRAYALSLAGANQRAERTLATVQGKFKETPDWVPLLHAFNKFELNELEEACQKNPQDKRTQYLRMMCYLTEFGAQKMKVCTELLSQQEDCISGYFWMMYSAELGLQSKMPRLACSYYSKSLPTYLVGFSNFLSLDANDLVMRLAGNSTKVDSEKIQSRAELISTLNPKGSLAEQELRQVLIEIDFMLASMLHKYIGMLGVDSRKSLPQYVDLVKYHPYAEAFSYNLYSSSDRKHAGGSVFQSNSAHFRFFRVWNLYWLFKTATSTTAQWEADLDDLYFDVLATYYIDSPGSDYWNKKGADLLSKISPGCPLVAVQNGIKAPNDQANREQLQGTMKRLQLSAVTVKAYGDYLITTHDYPMAVRLFEDQMKHEPLIGTYNCLSNALQYNQADDRYLEVLEEGLNETTALGLEHSEVCIKLGHDYRDRLEFAEAEKYYLIAARSYSGQSLSALTDHYIEQGEYAEAVKISQKQLERYRSFYGAITDAIRMMDNDYFLMLKSLIGPIDSNLINSGSITSGVGEIIPLVALDQGEAALQRLLKKSNGGWLTPDVGRSAVILQVMMFHELGKIQERDRDLDHLQTVFVDEGYPAKVPALIKKVFTTQIVPSKTELEEFDRSVERYFLLQTPADLYYGLGKSLLLAGHERLGTEYLTKSARSDNDTFLRDAARLELMKKGVSPVKTVNVRPGSGHEKLQAKKRMLMYYENRDHARCAQICDEILKQDPDEPYFLVYLLKCLSRLDDHGRFYEVATRAVKAMPDGSFILRLYGDALERSGKYMEAIQIYESLAGRDHVSDRVSLDRRARIYAACENEQFRDREKALATYEILSKKYGASHDLYDLKAMIEALKGDFSKAVKTIEKRSSSQIPNEDQVAAEHAALYKEEKIYVRSEQWWKHELDQWHHNK